jgi:hypothetical protein
VDDETCRCVTLCRFPARSYGWTTYCPFVGSAAFPHRLSSMSISRLLNEGSSLHAKSPRTTFGSSASTGESSSNE